MKGWKAFVNGKEVPITTAHKVYQQVSVPAGKSTVTFSAAGGHVSMPVTLAAGSVHSIFVLDGSSGLRIDNVTPGFTVRIFARKTAPPNSWPDPGWESFGPAGIRRASCPATEGT